MLLISLKFSETEVGKEHKCQQTPSNSGQLVVLTVILFLEEADDVELHVRFSCLRLGLDEVLVHLRDFDLPKKERQSHSI